MLKNIECIKVNYIFCVILFFKVLGLSSGLDSWDKVHSYPTPIVIVLFFYDKYLNNSAIWLLVDYFLGIWGQSRNLGI